MVCVEGETGYHQSVLSITRAGGETPEQERRLVRQATQGSRWQSSDPWQTLEQMVRGRVQQ